MKTLDIFYQSEGLREFEHIEIGADKSFSALKEILVQKCGLGADVLIFVEDQDEPVNELVLIVEVFESGNGKIHVHRCHHVEVAVTFNGETVKHRFGPGATVAKVKRWAAERKFKMTPEEAGEHVLQISKTHDRPKPGTHLGALAACPKCLVAFDLIPDERVNG